MIKNKLLLTILLSLSLFIPSTIYADCTKEELDAFKEIEDEFIITTSFEAETKKNLLLFTNPDPSKYGFKITNNADNEEKTTIDLTNFEDKEFGYPDLKPGDYAIEIFGKTENCNEKLKTISVTVSKYNKYSEDPLCEGIEEFVLCQPTYDKDIDYDTFESRVNAYKNNAERKKTTEDNQTETKDNIIIKYVKDNVIQIIIVALFIIMLVITVILTAKSYRKSRRLE